MKDHLRQTKDMIEGRAEKGGTVEERIKMLRDELKKYKETHEDFKTKLIHEISATKSEIAKVKAENVARNTLFNSDLIAHECYLDKNAAGIGRIELGNAQLRTYVDGKIEEMQFECSRGVTATDLK